MMDTKELKTKSQADLHKLLADTREKTRELRFKDSGKQLKNVRQLRVAKKDAARILTEINAQRSK